MKIKQLLKDMKVEKIPTDKLVPYENNARLNEDAVPGVAASIRQFGFRNPILVDKDNVIIEGHTRRLAAIQLGMKEVPIIRCTDLTKKQIAALRLVDNKVSEMSSWDFTKLDQELAAIAEMDGDDLDMGELGFPDLDDDPLGAAGLGENGEIRAEGAPAGVASGTPTGGAAVAGIGGNLPPELAGRKLTPDEQEKIDVEAPTSMERVIIVFKAEQRKAFSELLGFVPDKVVYTFDEVAEKLGAKK